MGSGSSERSSSVASWPNSDVVDMRPWWGLVSLTTALNPLSRGDNLHPLTLGDAQGAGVFLVQVYYLVTVDGVTLAILADLHGPVGLAKNPPLGQNERVVDIRNCGRLGHVYGLHPTRGARHGRGCTG